MLKKFIIGTFAIAIFAIAGSAFAAYDFGPTTLKVGSKGQYVMNLQTVVGATPIDGIFGNMTKAKVMAWQSSNGLVADGLVGPATKNALNAGTFTGGTTTSTVAGCSAGALFSSTTGASCTSVSTLPAGCTAGALFSSTTGVACVAGATPVVAGLTGSFGTISTINQLSQYSSEEIGSGSANVKIAGFELKPASGDISLTAMKLMFDATGYTAGDSTRITDYLTKVSVYMGSTLVGSVSTADFAKDSTGIYSLTMPLNGAVVRKDVVTPFYISVDAVSNLDSEDINSDSWKVAIESVRYVDGSGVTTTDTASIPAAMYYDQADDGVVISFVTFATAAGTELKISADTGNPVANTIKVSTTADTKGVTLLKGKLKLEGTSDVWLDELPFVLTASATSISAITSSVNLTIDGKTFTESTGVNCVSEVTAGWATADSCDATTTAGIVFDNLGLTIKAGSTVYFTVTADINDIEATGVVATDFVEGMSLLATFTTTTTTGARAHIVAENAQGDQLTDATEMTGSITGVAQVFRSVGISVALVSTNKDLIPGDGTTATPIDDAGTFTITFDVTANGDDVWVDHTAPTIDTSLVGTDLVQTGTGTLVATLENIAGGSVAPETAGTHGFAVRNGTTQRFVVTAHVSATADGYFNIGIGTAGIGYNVGEDADGDVAYTTGLTAFKTANLYMNEY